MTDNIYHRTVPSKLLIGTVSNAGYSGDFNKNPFDFKQINLNYLEVTVDGQPVPNRVILRKEISFHPTYLYWIMILTRKMGLL